MKIYARFSTVAAQATGVVGIIHALFSSPPPPTSFPITHEQLHPWTPPSWFPQSGEQGLWVLADLNAPPVFERGPKVRASSAIIADLDSGEVLWAHSADERVPVASLTKTISSLALMSTAPDLDRDLCVDSALYPTRSGARSKFSTGECHPGWTYLGAALVASDNRGAMGLAALSGLPYAEFINQMQTVSEQLGLSATWSDPSGLEDDNLASARDMLKAIVAVAEHPTLSMVASARRWQLAQDRGTKRLGTTNKLVSRWETEAAKTGYTDTAHYCFSQVVRTRDGRRLATVVLGAPTKDARFSDTQRMIEWATKNPPQG